MLLSTMNDKSDGWYHHVATEGYGVSPNYAPACGKYPSDFIAAAGKGGVSSQGYAHGQYQSGIYRTTSSWGALNQGYAQSKGHPVILGTSQENVHGRGQFETPQLKASGVGQWIHSYSDEHPSAILTTCPGSPAYAADGASQASNFPRKKSSRKAKKDRPPKPDLPACVLPILPYNSMNCSVQKYERVGSALVTSPCVSLTQLGMGMIRRDSENGEASMEIDGVPVKVEEYNIKFPGWCLTWNGASKTHAPLSVEVIASTFDRFIEQLAMIERSECAPASNRVPMCSLR
eukprot:TRINITY_DN30262_c0_g1_i1.p1 TRINITY_DN30262_c0_g1~~TRINITY_DN30262_c0_g1_i1.p1  ORF type:complete len:325 (-),score=27.37 TRINITY_DN30262_c0_g1_i1:293-1159(-)